jgi:tRNA (cmo5U34)-methyltransferase
MTETGRAIPGRDEENWFDDAFVAEWLDRQASRTLERERRYAMVRSLILRAKDEPFKILDIAGGDGWLDERLLQEFPRAEATVVDGSPEMVRRAAERFQEFGGRGHVAQVDLMSPDWRIAAGGPFDFIVSTIALHNLEDPARVRDLYGEVYELTAEGGLFVNFDYVRAASISLGRVFQWASADPDAGFMAVRGYRPYVGSVDEHVGWLREAGYSPADCFWRELRVALFGGFRGPIRVPNAR